jgi:predicted enzyme related to lactoylglutathione lyase
MNVKSVAAVLAAQDIERAKAFYSEKLGWEPSEQLGQDSVMYSLHGTPVLLYQTGFAGTARNTVLAIEVEDLQAEMESLRSVGVTFEEYDMPGLTTTDGVVDLDGELAAWFTDSEGNIISLNQRN